MSETARSGNNDDTPVPRQECRRASRLHRRFRYRLMIRLVTVILQCGHDARKQLTRHPGFRKSARQAQLRGNRADGLRLLYRRKQDPRPARCGSSLCFPNIDGATRRVQQSAPGSRRLDALVMTGQQGGPERVLGRANMLAHCRRRCALVPQQRLRFPLRSERPPEMEASS